MKLIEKAIEEFKSVDFMLEVHDQISTEIKDMNFAELKKKLRRKKVEMSNQIKTLHQIRHPKIVN